MAEIEVDVKVLARAIVKATELAKAGDPVGIMTASLLMATWGLMRGERVEGFLSKGMDADEIVMRAIGELESVLDGTTTVVLR